MHSQWRGCGFRASIQTSWRESGRLNLFLCVKHFFSVEIELAVGVIMISEIFIGTFGGTAGSWRTANGITFLYHFRGRNLWI